MKNKATKFLMAVLIGISLSLSVKASHDAGDYITYEYAGLPNTYIIKLHHYRDCAGVLPPFSVDICYSSVSLNYSAIINLSPIQGTGNVVSVFSCSGAIINCSMGAGIEEWVYADTVVLPQTATDWVFAFEACCRNNAITNFFNPSGNGLLVYSTLDNYNAPANSSPFFADSLVKQFCINYFSNINYHCIDIDGDSLVYTLVSAIDGTTCPLSYTNLVYAPPYSPSYPLASSTPLGLNSTTGILAFTPSLIQIGQVCLTVDEYRNGVLIGTVRRDDQVWCIPGVPNPSFITGNVFNDLNKNNIKDSNENGLSGAILQLNPGNLYYSTNQNGDYTIPVDTGSYTIILTTKPKYTVVLPDSNFASFLALNLTDSLNDFALQVDSSILDIALSASCLPVNRPCDTLNLTLQLNNIGGAIGNGVLFLSMDTAVTPISFNPQPDSIVGNNIWWNVLNITPSSLTSFLITYKVNCSALIGTTIQFNSFFTTDTLEYYQSDNSISKTIKIVNSYDPNIKEVNFEVISPLFIANREWLVYTIHFQNTGNAPAINVNITDTIRNALDPGSFELIGSSHPCTFDLHGSGIIDFNFNNIYLPDSFSNEAASHGYVQYRIKPKWYLPLNQIIQNTAHIFFDNNPAIVTNTTQTLVANVAAIQVNNGISGFEVFPNPFNATLTIQPGSSGISDFELLDLAGRVLLQKQISHSETFDMNSFSNGVYIVRATNLNGRCCYGKVIKN